MDSFVQPAIKKFNSFVLASQTRTRAGLLVLLLLAFLLRLVGLYKSPLWYDEVLSLHRWAALLESMAQNLNLWALVLRFFADPIRLRWPAMICSILAIWLAGRIMIQLQFDRTQRVAGLLTLACLPGLLWICARMPATILALP